MIMGKLRAIARPKRRTLEAIRKGRDTSIPVSGQTDIRKGAVVAVVVARVRATQTVLAT